MDDEAEREWLQAQYLCLDCGKDTDKSGEYYGLHFHVWFKINPAILGMLCLGCAERRLGRDLTAADFADVPINEEQARVCPELALRLSRI